MIDLTRLNWNSIVIDTLVLFRRWDGDSFISLIENVVSQIEGQLQVSAVIKGEPVGEDFLNELRLSLPASPETEKVIFTSEGGFVIKKDR